ncbi:MAG: nucleotide sugar dehydrogenase [Nanoarchaeota archaeon]
MLDLKDIIEKREATVTVVGLGYVGLPLALAFSKAGFRVTGFDVDENKVKKLNESNDITGENENSEIKKAIEDKLFITSDTEKIPADFVLVCVPTPTDTNNKPDLSPIESASILIGNNMKRDSIIVLESTVYPGVTEEIMKPIIEKESGLVCGTDFSLAYSPERINPGDKVHILENTIKVVGGYDKETTDIVADFYGTVISAGIKKVNNIKTAEAVKIVENVQRAVNISLINELAVVFDKMGINTHEVIEAAKTKWNFHPYYPNAGVGGHCISVDPYYLIHKSKEFGYDPKIMSSSMEINEFMPRHVTNMIMNHLSNKESKVVLLGLTYKENVSDIRNTPAEKIAKEFSKNNIKVFGYDPFLDNDVIEKMGITPLNSLENITDVDAFLFLVAHDKLKTITNEDFKKMASNNAIIFDAKKILNKEKIESLGIKYKTF